MKFDELVEKYVKGLGVKRGHQFGKAGAGKAGPMKSKKEKMQSPKKQRQAWKKEVKDYTG